ncbi:MAG: sigma-70 family RNA polymerase sigma factor [Dehalococcoidia bacterium]
MDLEQLVRSAQAGDVESFNRLVLAHQDQVYSLAYRFMGQRAAAEDATQEAFVRAFRAIRSFRGEHFRAWLLSITANACRDELRRQRRRPTRSLDAPALEGEASAPDPADPGPSPEAAALNAELRAALERALLQLPEEWRLVVVLTDVHGLSYEEVSIAAGLPLGTVKSRISRARGRLRDILLATGELTSPAGRLTS